LLKKYGAKEEGLNPYKRIYLIDFKDKRIISIKHKKCINKKRAEIFL